MFKLKKPDPFGLSIDIPFMPDDLLKKKRVTNLVSKSHVVDDVISTSNKGIKGLRDYIQERSTRQLNGSQALGQAARVYFAAAKAAERVDLPSRENLRRGALRGGAGFNRYVREEVFNEKEFKEGLRNAATFGISPWSARSPYFGGHAPIEALPGKQHPAESPSAALGHIASGERAQHALGIDTEYMRRLHEQGPLGRLAYYGIDTATAPLTIATALAGAPAGAGLRGGMVGRPLYGRLATRLGANLVEPAAGPSAGLARTYLTETVLGAGAGLGSEYASHGAQKVGAPGPLAYAAGLLGGFVGGAGAMTGMRGAEAGARGGFERLRPTPPTMGITTELPAGEPMVHATPHDIELPLRPSEGGDIFQGFYGTINQPENPHYLQDYGATGDLFYNQDKGISSNPMRIGEREIRLYADENMRFLDAFSPLDDDEWNAVLRATPEPVRNEFLARHPNGPQYVGGGKEVMRSLSEAFDRAYGESSPYATKGNEPRVRPEVIDVMRQAGWHGLHGNREYLVFPQDIALLKGMGGQQMRFGSIAGDEPISEVRRQYYASAQNPNATPMSEYAAAWEAKHPQEAIAGEDWPTAISKLELATSEAKANIDKYSPEQLKEVIDRINYYHAKVGNFPIDEHILRREASKAAIPVGPGPMEKKLATPHTQGGLTPHGQPKSNILHDVDMQKANPDVAETIDPGDTAHWNGDYWEYWSNTGEWVPQADLHPEVADWLDDLPAPVTEIGEMNLSPLKAPSTAPAGVPVSPSSTKIEGNKVQAAYKNAGLTPSVLHSNYVQTGDYLAWDEKAGQWKHYAKDGEELEWHNSGGSSAQQLNDALKKIPPPTGLPKLEYGNLKKLIPSHLTKYLSPGDKAYWEDGHWKIKDFFQDGESLWIGTKNLGQSGKDLVEALEKIPPPGWESVGPDVSQTPTGPKVAPSIKGEWPKPDTGIKTSTVVLDPEELPAIEGLSLEPFDEGDLFTPEPKPVSPEEIAFGTLEEQAAKTALPKPTPEQMAAPKYNKDDLENLQSYLEMKVKTTTGEEQASFQKKLNETKSLKEKYFPSFGQKVAGFFAGDEEPSMGMVSKAGGQGKKKAAAKMEKEEAMKRLGDLMQKMMDDEAAAAAVAKPTPKTGWRKMAEELGEEKPVREAVPSLREADEAALKAADAEVEKAVQARTEDLDAIDQGEPPRRLSGPISGGSDEEIPRIGGGSVVPLVFPKAPRKGYTMAERASDVVERTIQVLSGSRLGGVRAHEVATPIAREGLRRHNQVASQARHFATLAKRAESMFQIDPETGESAKYRKPGIIVTNAATGEPHGVSQGWTLDELAHRKRGLPNMTDAEKRMLAQLVEKEDQFRAHVDLLHKGGAKSINVARKKGTWLTAHAVEAYGEKVANQTLNRYFAETKKALQKNGELEKKVPKEFQDVLDKATHKSVQGLDPNIAVRTVQAVNHAAKLVWAGVDMSLWGINALLSFADNPIASAKMAKVAGQSLMDENALAKYMENFDARAARDNTPTVAEYLAGNMHLSGTESARTDIERATGGLIGKIGDIPVIKHFNRSFGTGGDVMRLEMADFLWRQAHEMKGGGITRGKVPVLTNLPIEGKSREQIIQEIGAAMNRSTGYSNTSFGGGIGELTLFAPKFLQSQLETVQKAFVDGGIEGAVARRQLVKLIAIGTTITMLANESRGKETEFNPIKDGKVNPNFMKIKDVGGVDISVFGTWDSLARVAMQEMMGIPGVPGEGSLLYGVETKGSPIVSLIRDYAKGENYSGVKFNSPEYWMRFPLPFAEKEIGRDPWTGTAVGFFGGKATPLSRTERVDKELEQAGIKKGDPDYEIKSRDYIAEHPELVEEGRRGKYEESAQISKNIREREQLNDSRTQEGGQTLVEFRENRKLLNKEKRDKLAIALGDFEGHPKTKQEKWIDSYYRLFEQANPDPITGEPDGDVLDQLQLEWIANNGTDAMDFINRFTLSGQTTVERAYLSDLQKLKNAGYFDTPKYRDLKSDLDETQIDDYRNMVSAARSRDDSLPDDYGKAAKKVLAGMGLSADEISDVINAGKSRYANPEYEALKASMNKELAWFNPDMRWEDYVNATGKKVESKKKVALSGSFGKRPTYGRRR